jgi:protein-L-isoaspartate(D-aspartate) O-methyltransferase
MVRRLTTDGALTAEWREAFLTVPRHAFIPDVVWRRDADNGDVDRLTPLRRADDPARWLELSYDPGYVITQVDDGYPTGPGMIGRTVTSSVSRPDVVALMLAVLRAEPGMRVCEIGTGTGYNAALLAARLGAGQVVTIEIDPGLAAHARRALAETGFGEVTVVTGDGERGHPARAPYDRVLATVAAPYVPYEWVAQTCPGGRIVTPWATRYYPAGLLSLVVGDDGTAVGGIVNNTVSFMWLRGQRAAPMPPARQLVRDGDTGDTARLSRTDLHPARVANDYDAPFAIGLLVPNCEFSYHPATDDSGRYAVWFIDPTSRSWAIVEYEPGASSYRVRQAGQRMLWDDVEAAYHRWVDLDRPKVDQWRFTITSEGQHIELACDEVEVRSAPAL